MPPSEAKFYWILFFLHDHYKPCPEDAVYQISEYLEVQFMGSYFQNSPNFPLLGPNRGQLFDFTQS